MPSIYDLKPAFQQLLRPILHMLIQAKVTPNQITLVALFLSLAGGLMLLFFRPTPWALIVMPILLFVRMALNALDGMLARECQLASQSGEILNELGDVISDAFLYAPLVLYLPPTLANWAFLFMFLFLAQLSEFCGILAKCVTGVRRYEGPMGKSDRAFLIGLFCIALYFWPPVIYYSAWIFGIASVLLAWSAYNRIRPNTSHQNANVS